MCFFALYAHFITRTNPPKITSSGMTFSSWDSPIWIRCFHARVRLTGKLNRKFVFEIYCLAWFLIIFYNKRIKRVCVGYTTNINPEHSPGDFNTMPAINRRKSVNKPQNWRQFPICSFFMTTLSAGKYLDGLERIELDLIYRFLTFYSVIYSRK